MLFNSVPFLFLILPMLLLVFCRLGRVSPRMAAAWMLAGSLFFYGWWNPVYLGLLLASIIFNYLVGCGLGNFTRVLGKIGLMKIGACVCFDFDAWISYSLGISHKIKSFLIVLLAPKLHCASLIHRRPVCI
jgi:hypothetical protein